MTKKLLTLFLTFALLFSLSLSCFASNNSYVIINPVTSTYYNINVSDSDGYFTVKDSEGNLIIDKGTRILQFQGYVTFDGYLNGKYTDYTKAQSGWVVTFTKSIDTELNPFINENFSLLDLTIKSKDFISVLDNATEQITVFSVVGVLAFICLAVVGLVFVWWGVRKVIRALMSAFKKGKISI